jgi:hypothetical protein
MKGLLLFLLINPTQGFAGNPKETKAPSRMKGTEGCLIMIKSR